MPVLVRSVDDVQGEARVNGRVLNQQQLAAVEARGEVFVSAGAGTGKTSVLVERFVRAVCDDRLDVATFRSISTSPFSDRMHTCDSRPPKSIATCSTAGLLACASCAFLCEARFTR